MTDVDTSIHTTPADLGDIAAFADGTVVTDWFLAAVRENPDAPALRAKSGDDWVETTWAEYADQATRVAGALKALGVGVGDRVLLMLRNRPEFHVCDVASMLLRATPVSIYNSSAPEQIEYLARHCQAKVAIVDGPDFLARLLEVRESLPDLSAVVTIDQGDTGRPDGVLGWNDLLDGDPVDLEASVEAQEPTDLITIIYTSGTTGNPKGVMLDHANVAWEVAGYADLVAQGRAMLQGFEDQPHVDLPMVGSYPVGMRYVSYLPMAHIAERMVTHYGTLFLRGTVTTCPDQLRLAEYLVGTRPNVLFGPPRVWEKLRSGILAAVKAAGPEKEAGFGMALQVGEKYDELQRAGAEIPEELQQQHDFLAPIAYDPLLQRVGLDQAIICFSGAAPLPKEVAVFFRSLGVNFSEVYGMSENTGGMTWSPFSAVPGTVGKPWPGTEIRLGDDGEVLARGGIVSRGYLNDPERTAETFDDEGWLHTGDIGVWTDDGDLRIVDRKKELIITAGGKNISPANLEARLKMIPLVGQAAVIGDGRKFLSALLVLDPDAAPVWAAGQEVAFTSLADLAADERVLAAVQAGVDEVNQHFASVEQIKKFVLVGDEWVPDSEQLTATMKLKRRGVNKVYAELIESMYADD
ncbi:MAG: long-chain fatty acid--CoA ligase [Candidatus Nanopelagicales bacterium]